METHFIYSCDSFLYWGLVPLGFAVLLLRRLSGRLHRCSSIRLDCRRNIRPKKSSSGTVGARCIRSGSQRWSLIRDSCKKTADKVNLDFMTGRRQDIKPRKSNLHAQTKIESPFYPLKTTLLPCVRTKRMPPAPTESPLESYTIFLNSILT